MTEQIIKAMESSKLWANLNASVKALYEKENRVPSEKEYQALRNMLIMKVMSEDKTVFEMMAKSTWETLRA